MSAAHQALAKARSLTQIGRWREAMEVLAPALATDATATEAHCLRALCLIQLGQPRDAAASARQALAANPDDEWAHRLLAIALLRAKRHRAAVAEAAEAVRLAPQSVGALHALAVCQLRLTPMVAEQTARAAVAADPYDPLAHQTLATVAAARGDYATAERAFREGLRLAPDSHDLALGLARLMHRQGRRDEAATAYLAAAGSNPVDVRARQGLARLGLPLAGAGAFGAIKIAAFLAAEQASGGWFSVGEGASGPRPPELAIILGIGLLAGGTISVVRRVRGTRNLPEHVRRGLRADHLNAALRWLRIAAFFALLLGIRTATLPAKAGGGLGAAMWFVAFAALSFYAVRRLWIGPRPSAAATARALLERVSVWRRI